jgi:release factor glutamine methyltransferase
VLTDSAEVTLGSCAMVGAALAEARALLVGSSTAAIDAELLLAHVLGRGRAWVIAHHEALLSASEQLRFAELVKRRSLGEPVAYLLGSVHWYDLELEVCPAVLVPRPESELLLERACRLATALGAHVAADVGTGSGALAIGLARCCPSLVVTAVDRSVAALEIARRNVMRYQLGGRISLRAGNLIEPLEHKPDMLVANLPYLSDSMMEELDIDVRYEPRLALHGGFSGLELYGELRDMLERRKWKVPMVIEIDPRHGEIIPTLFAEYRVRLERDYAGLVRIAILLPGRDS